MLEEAVSTRYYLFSLANLIAAFEGGLILGKGMGIINSPYLHDGSVLAFFIGTILGLVFLQYIPKNWASIFAKYFSINGGIASLILLYIFNKNSYNNQLDGLPAILFFILLSIRFGFWFFSRVMRAATASSSEQSIAWVEMGYYLGMVLGLIIWKLLGFDINLKFSLVLDACLQFIAGFLDFKSGRVLEKSNPQHESTFPGVNSGPYNLQWCWKLAGAIIFFTIAIQVVLFNGAHYTSELNGTNLSGIFV